MSNSKAYRPKREEKTRVYTVRLNGDRTGPSTARIEGAGHDDANDIGNTFSIGQGSDFGEYLAYSTIWMGNTTQNSILMWNQKAYLAGTGSGDAGYAHSQLPYLDDDYSSTHRDPIVLEAQTGAAIEFRFLVEVE